MEDDRRIVGVPGDPHQAEEHEGLRPLPSHYVKCFGCGEDHPTGLHMKMVGGDLKVQGSFTVTEHHQGAPGLAHGGVVAAAMDEAMGFLLWLLKTLAVTARIEVDFRRPVPVGSTLQLQGGVEREEGRKIFAVMTGTLDGEVAVEARALFLKVRVQHFTPYANETEERPTYNP